MCTCLRCTHTRSVQIGITQVCKHSNMKSKSCFLLLHFTQKHPSKRFRTKSPKSLIVWICVAKQFEGWSISPDVRNVILFDAGRVVCCLLFCSIYSMGVLTAIQVRFHLKVSRDGLKHSFDAWTRGRGQPHWWRLGLGVGAGLPLVERRLFVWVITLI